MKEHFSHIVLKHVWEILTVIAICAVGIFLRTYNFGPWLHFEVDQTWDYTIVSHAVTGGIGNLPLLGPTAGGGRALRLGPAFYYMEYASALVFGNTPVGHAMLVLVLSLLTLPLFYLFVRRYFSGPVSLGLLAIASTSLYFIMYSRFSWSPNVLPFFMLLSFFALLKSVSVDETRRRTWFLIAAMGVAITTQIHFNAFFTVPAIVVAFLLIKRPHFDWKTWLAAIGIIVIIYSPMLASEIKTHGEDARFFFEKVGKSASHVEPLAEKISANVQYNAYEYFLIVTGNDQINGKIPSGIDLGLSCKIDCAGASRIPIRAVALLSFFAALVLLIIRLVKEPIGKRKDFLLLSLLWFVFSALYFFGIYDSNTLFPRFFLIVSPLAIIFFGFILQLLRPEKSFWRVLPLACVVCALAYMNVSMVFSYFGQLRNVSTTTEDIKLKDVFPFTDRATLQTQTQIADYVASIVRQNNHPVYIQCDHEYASVYWYLLNLRGIFNGIGKGPVPSQGNYFLITRLGSYDRLESAHQAKGFVITNVQSFGSLVVYTLTPQPAARTGDIMENSSAYVATQRAQISDIMTWNKLFKPLNQSAPGNSIEEEGDQDLGQ